MRRCLSKLNVLHQRLTGYRAVLSSQHQDLEITDRMVDCSVLRAAEVKSPATLDGHFMTDPRLRILGDVFMECLPCGICHAHRHLATVGSLQVIDDPLHPAGAAVLPGLIEKSVLRRLGEIEFYRRRIISSRRQRQCDRRHCAQKQPEHVNS